MHNQSPFPSAAHISQAVPFHEPVQKIYAALSDLLRTLPRWIFTVRKGLHMQLLPQAVVLV